MQFNIISLYKNNREEQKQHDDDDDDEIAYFRVRCTKKLV